MTATLTPIKAHYPLVTRTVLDLFEAGELPNIAEIQVEPAYGFVMRLIYHSGAVRLTRGHGIGANVQGASVVAKDKGYTKFFLQQLGYATPVGRVFPLPRRQAVLERALARHGAGVELGIEKLISYIESTTGYPCYLKPNRGSLGRGVTRCADAAEVMQTVEHFGRRGIAMLIVEAAINWPDHRVVVLDGEVVACYRRLPLSVTGDGSASIRRLLAERYAEWAAQRRSVILSPEDPRIAQHLAQQGLDFASVPPAGNQVTLVAISNLSSGGSAEDCSDLLHPHWRELCGRVSAAMGLRFCGVDLACADITDPAAPYSILELNDSPGMEHFAKLGPAQLARARDIYRRLFNEVLGRE